MADRVEPCEPSRWRRTAEPEHGPVDDAEPEHAEPGAADVLDAQAERDYRRGQSYAVFVPGPRVLDGRTLGEPRLRYRVCADPGDRAEGGTREPVFVTTAEWDELRRAEDRAADRADFERRIGEVLRMVPKASPAAEVLADTTPLRQLAAELGVTVETIKRRLRTAEVPLIELSSHDYRVRNEDLRVWLEATRATDPRDAGAIIDACRDAIGQDPRRARLRAVSDDESDDELRRRIAEL